MAPSCTPVEPLKWRLLGSRSKGAGWRAGSSRPGAPGAPVVGGHAGASLLFGDTGGSGWAPPSRLALSAGRAAARPGEGPALAARGW